MLEPVLMEPWQCNASPWKLICFYEVCQSRKSCTQTQSWSCVSDVCRHRAAVWRLCKASCMLILGSSSPSFLHSAVHPKAEGVATAGVWTNTGSRCPASTAGSEARHSATTWRANEWAGGMPSGWREEDRDWRGGRGKTVRERAHFALACSFYVNIGRGSGHLILGLVSVRELGNTRRRRAARPPVLHSYLSCA